MRINAIKFGDFIQWLYGTLSILIEIPTPSNFRIGPKYKFCENAESGTTGGKRTLAAGTKDRTNFAKADIGGNTSAYILDDRMKPIVAVF